MRRRLELITLLLCAPVTGMAAAVDWYGAWRIDASYRWHDSERGYHDFARLRLGLELTADVELTRRWRLHANGAAFRDFAYDLARTDLPQPVRDARRNEAEVGETYLQGVVGPVDLRVGRQVINWGGADILRVVDVLNPTDNREPGVVDLRDRRLPVAATRLDYYPGAWSVSAVLLHERRFDRNPVAGGEFFPGERAAPQRTPPGGRQQWALSLARTVGDWDASLFAARLFDHTAHVVPGPEPQRRHAHVDFVGASVSRAVGAWIVKADAAHLVGTRFDGGLERARSDVLAGLEYYGLGRASVAIELANRHVHDHDASIPARRDGLELAARFDGRYLNEALRLSASVVGFHRRGTIARVTATYAVGDRWELGLGAAVYSGDVEPFATFDRNDRWFFTARRSFWNR